MKVVKLVLKCILIAIVTLLGAALTYICYSPKVVYAAIAVLLIALIVVEIKAKQKKGLFITILVILMLIMPFLTADGIFYGDKVEFKAILIRGLCRFQGDNLFFSDESMMNKNLPTGPYGKTGMRETSWKVPEGYTYNRFQCNNVNLEYLEYSKHNDRAVLMIHGGAYIGKMSDILNDLAPYYSEAAGGANVLVVDYSVASEGGYPQNILDVITGYQWLQDQGYTNDKILFAGDSAGGGLALATALYLRDHGEVLPKGIVTLSAWTNLNCDTDSQKTNRDVDANFARNHMMLTARDIYVKGHDVNDIYISPYYADFHDFPAVLMLVGNYEMIRDDSVDLVTKAKASGYNFQVITYPGMFHEFQILKGKLKVADESWNDISNFIEGLYK